MDEEVVSVVEEAVEVVVEAGLEEVEEEEGSEEEGSEEEEEVEGAEDSEVEDDDKRSRLLYLPQRKLLWMKLGRSC